MNKDAKQAALVLKEFHAFSIMRDLLRMIPLSVESKET